MTITRLLARPMLATIFVVGGANALRKTEAHAEKAKKVTDKVVPLAQQAAPSLPIPSDPATLVRINAGAQILAAAALATGRAPRLSATVLAASLVPTTLAGHRFFVLPASATVSGAVVLAVNLSHPAWAIRDVTGSGPRSGYTLGVTLDCNLVLRELVNPKATGAGWTPSAGASSRW